MSHVGLGPLERWLFRGVREAVLGGRNVCFFLGGGGLGFGFEQSPRKEGYLSSTGNYLSSCFVLGI